MNPAEWSFIHWLIVYGSVMIIIVTDMREHELKLESLFAVLFWPFVLGGRLINKFWRWSKS